MHGIGDRVNRYGTLNPALLGRKAGLLRPRELKGTKVVGETVVKADEA